MPSAPTLPRALTAMTDRLALLASRRLPWPQALALAAAAAAFYAGSAAGNLSETDDAHAFAYRVERFGMDHVSDPRLLGYHTLARLLWLLAQSLGLPISGLDVLRGISVVAAVGCLWLVHRILLLRLAVAPLPALLTTGLLAFSYGYWRYAAEADVYALAMLLCAWLLYRLLDDRPLLAGRALFDGALAGLAVLVYQPNAIAVLLAFPLLLWRGGFSAWRVAVVPLACYGMAAGAVLLGGYLWGFAVFWSEPLSVYELRRFLAQRSEEFMVPPLSIKTVLVSAVRSALALGHDIVSSNWVFGLPQAERLVHRLFSNNTIDEELFLARQAGALVFVPLLLLPLVAGSAFGLLRAALPLSWASLAVRPLPVLLWWTLLTALVIGRLNPAGIEAWIVVLLPLALLLGVLVVGPACTRGGAPWALALLVAMLLHNTLGGMALVHSPQGDLTRLRGQWVEQHATAADLVVVAQDANLAESLRYLSRAQVLRTGAQPLLALQLAAALGGGRDPANPVESVGRDFAGIDLYQTATEALARGGRVIVFSEFFDLLAHARSRDDTLPAAAAEFRQRSVEVFRSPDGMTTHVFERSGGAPVAAAPREGVR